MATDRVTVHVSHLTESVDVSHPDAVHAVGVSHLGEYLEAMYGPSVPHDEDARLTTSRLLGALAHFSTDDELTDVFQSDPSGYLRAWINLMAPVVEATEEVGDIVEGWLSDEGRYSGPSSVAEEEPSPFLQDLTYLLGVHDITTFVLATQLQIDHPRYKNTELMRRSAKVSPHGHELVQGPDLIERFALDLLLSSRLTALKDKADMQMLERRSTRILERAEGFLAAIVAAVETSQPPEQLPPQEPGQPL